MKKKVSLIHIKNKYLRRFLVIISAFVLIPLEALFSYLIEIPIDIIKIHIEFFKM